MWLSPVGLICLWRRKATSFTGLRVLLDDQLSEEMMPREDEFIHSGRNDFPWTSTSSVLEKPEKMHTMCHKEAAGNQSAPDPAKMMRCAKSCQRRLTLLYDKNDQLAAWIVVVMPSHVKFFGIFVVFDLKM